MHLRWRRCFCAIQCNVIGKSEIRFTRDHSRCKRIIGNRRFRQIDIHIDVPAVNYKEMRAGVEPEGSTKIRERVVRAREIQLQRFAACQLEKLYSNAQMTARHIRTFCELSADCESLLERAMLQQGLTARAHDRILKVARTIADLDGREGVGLDDVSEAIGYRVLDRPVG